MAFKVLIADSALTDLKEIVEFVAHDDPVAAVRLGEKLVECALSLQTMPARFSFHDQQRGIRSPLLARRQTFAAVSWLRPHSHTTSAVVPWNLLHYFYEY